MRTMIADHSTLLVIDLQARLMPVIDGGESVVANARRLIEASTLFEIPAFLTEQNPAGLGGTVASLNPNERRAVTKMTFDACRTPAFTEALPSDRRDIVVAGCEAHVCVLQTVLGLLNASRRVFVVRDAVGSRRPENKDAALRRLERHGAEIVTTEMVVFEWLATSEHPRFKQALALIR